MFTYLMRLLISRDNSTRRFVAAPAFARRVCFSLSLFILAARAFSPRRDTRPCSGSVSVFPGGRSCLPMF